MRRFSKTVKPCDVFPLVIRTAADGSCYEGYIDAGSQSFYIRLSDIPDMRVATTLKGAKLDFGDKLGQALGEYQSVVLQRLERSTSIANFFLELQDILDKVNPPSKPDLFSVESCNAILCDLAKLGWENVKSISDDLKTVEVNIHDQMSRLHVLRLEFPSDYPQSSPASFCALPVATQVRWDWKRRLEGLVQDYGKVLEKYQNLWNNLDDLDEHTWIVEPECPNRSVTWRRVALGNFQSLNLKLSIEDASAPPEFQFFGPDSSVQKLKTQLQEKLYRCWDKANSIRINVENCLDIKLPGRKNVSENVESLQGDCGICYALRLQDEKTNEIFLPDIFCENSLCARPYHLSCLREWLESLPNVRESFYRLVGECPYCSSEISVSIA